MVTQNKYSSAKRWLVYGGISNLTTININSINGSGGLAASNYAINDGTHNFTLKRPVGVSGNVYMMPQRMHSFRYYRLMLT